MRKSILVAVLALPVLVGCGCVPQRVRQSAEAGFERSRKMGDFIRAGKATPEELKAYCLAEELDWTALLEALGGK